MRNLLYFSPKDQDDEVPTDEEIAFVLDMPAKNDIGCGGCFAEFLHFIGKILTEEKLMKLTNSLIKDPKIFSDLKENKELQQIMKQSEEEEIASKEGDGIFSRIWKSTKNFFEKLWNITKKLAASFVKSIGALYKKSEELVCSICVAIMTQIVVLWYRIYKKVRGVFKTSNITVKLC